MLPEVLRHRDLLAPGAGWRAFFEVPGPRGGIVDLIWVRFSRTALADRSSMDDAVDDMTSIRVLQAIGSGVRIEELARHAGVSRGHLTRQVLPRLTEASWIERNGRDWAPIRRFRPVVTGVITVELKRNDWRSALKQAARHCAASDASWVILDARRSGAATSAAASFAHVGVGLGGLAAHCDNCMEQQRTLKIIHPAQQNRFIDPIGRAYFGEKCLALLRQGVQSGPERPVFGRIN
jgi:hypothetical protein